MPRRKKRVDTLETEEALDVASPCATGTPTRVPAEQSAVASLGASRVAVLDRASSLIGRLLEVSELTPETWRHELRAISLSAAAFGDFPTAVAGYREIGKHMALYPDEKQSDGGRVVSQHLHLHTAAEAKHLSTDELERQLLSLRRMRDTAMPARPAPTPDDIAVEAALA